MNHDCCNKKTKKEGHKGGADMFIIWVIVVTVLLLGLAVHFGMKTGATTEVITDSQVTMSVDSDSYDWGMIDYDGGIVSKTFTINNSGNTSLQLYKVETSCMCTTAQLKTPETTSRKYGMHDNSTDVFEVRPGETADLIVEFDPAFHGPSGVGSINRTVTISTNSSENLTLTFNLLGNVVKN